MPLAASRLMARDRTGWRAARNVSRLTNAIVLLIAVVAGAIGLFAILHCHTYLQRTQTAVCPFLLCKAPSRRSKAARFPSNVPSTIVFLWICACRIHCSDSGNSAATGEPHHRQAAARTNFRCSSTSPEFRQETKCQLYSLQTSNIVPTYHALKFVHQYFWNVHSAQSGKPLR